MATPAPTEERRDAGTSRGTPGPTADDAPTAARLATLAVRDFRNLVAVDAPFPDDGVVVVGENGHGKSNLLEAIAYLRLLRSVRGARDRDLIRHGAPAFHVAASCAGAAVRRVSVGVDRQGRKLVTLDGAETTRLTEALDALPSVTFSPRDVDLVAGGPGERRRFLDITLALSAPAYLEALRQYRAALARRNAALREAVRRGAAAAGVAAWEPALARHGGSLVRARRAWVAASAPSSITRLRPCRSTPTLTRRTGLPAHVAAMWNAGAPCRIRSRSRAPRTERKSRRYAIASRRFDFPWPFSPTTTTPASGTLAFTATRLRKSRTASVASRAAVGASPPMGAAAPVTRRGTPGRASRGTPSSPRACPRSGPPRRSAPPRARARRRVGGPLRR